MARQAGGRQRRTNLVQDARGEQRWIGDHEYAFDAQSLDARGEFTRRVDARLAAASFFATAGAIISGKVFRDGELSTQEMNRQFLQVTFSGLASDAGGEIG